MLSKVRACLILVRLVQTMNVDCCGVKQYCHLVQQIRRTLKLQHTNISTPGKKGKKGGRKKWLYFATSGAKISAAEVPIWKLLSLFSKYSFGLAFIFLELQFLELVNAGPKSCDKLERCLQLFFMNVLSNRYWFKV